MVMVFWYKEVMWEDITIFKMSREEVWTSCPSCDAFKLMRTTCLFYVKLLILLIQIFVGYGYLLIFLWIFKVYSFIR